MKRLKERVEMSSLGRLKPTLKWGIALGLMIAVMLAGCGGSSSTDETSPTGTDASAESTSGGDGETYKVVLSNSFVGNDWRQEFEALAAASVKYPPFEGRIDYELARSENSATSQIASLNSVILEKPDAIVINPSSPTALNGVIEQACAQGIVVVVVDASVTAKCPYQVGPNWHDYGLIQGKWLGKAMGGKGSVFLDRGLPGVSLATDLLEAYKEGLAEYPDIEIAGEFTSEFALGPEQSGVANLLAAHPDVGGIATSAYGAGAIKALQSAGLEQVPVVGSAYNTSFLTCMNTQGAECILGSEPAYLSVEGINVALNVLEGKEEPKQKYLPLLFYTNTDVTVPGAEFEQMENGVNAFPDAPPGLYVPFKPPFMPQMTLQDALGES